jgi:hypothetical protein
MRSGSWSVGDNDSFNIKFKCECQRSDGLSHSGSRQMCDTITDLVWRLSKFAAHVLGKPSACVSTTSVGMLRIVEVMGAMVTEFRMPIAESRVSISTGRFLSGVLKEYQQTSPRLTLRPNPAHP